MALTNIEIKNCKSIKNINITLTDLNCLLGENGTGKTNILKAVKYLYDNLSENKVTDDLFDKTNPYLQYFEISFYYDFTNLLKISESHIERSNIRYYELNPIFKKIKSIYQKYKNINGKVKITLKQSKKGLPEWNVPYETRTFIKNIFPIYFTQVRHLDLVNWDELWNIIGELSKTVVKDKNNYMDEIEGILQEAFGERYSTILKYIEKEFKESNVEVSSFNSKQKFANIYQMQLGGDEFKHEFESLDFFSDGMNSYNYIKLLIGLISKISETKIKEPLIILDEPEIGLHPKYIDELVEVFLNKNKNVNILFSTHSSRLVKNLVSNEKGINLYHISLEKKYTKLKKMKSFADKRGSNIVSEQEASYYFAKKIVFVEGVTEIELLTNKNIQSLFPFLKKTEFYSYESNHVKLNLVHPTEKNLSIPYMVLVDFDQILKYNKHSKHFEIKKAKKFTNPLNSQDAEKKEILFYGLKRKRTYDLKKRINGLINKSYFLFNNFGYIAGNDSYFKLLKSLIKNYCLEYHIYPVDTTIEGALINSKNEKIFYDWLLIYKSLKHHQSINFIYNSYNSIGYKKTVMRLIVDGKFDNLETVKELVGEIDKLPPGNYKNILSEISKVKISKTEGWVTKFINYFFENFINNKSDLTEEEKVSIFKKNFPEIHMIIHSIYELNED